jgi:hypothetical protein
VTFALCGSGAGLMVGMGMGALGGCMVPIEQFPTGCERSRI